jgi:hypothetical protein
MATDYLQVFIDKTTDRDITCYFYHRVLNCSYKQISEAKHLTINQVKHSIGKIIKIEEMPDKASALQALFCDFKEKE